VHIGVDLHLDVVQAPLMLSFILHLGKDHCHFARVDAVKDVG
jgi:hypothetical protein